MKLYINIDTSEQRNDLTRLCVCNNISKSGISDALGVYCLDNSTKSLSYPTEETVNSVPNSFRLKWDYRHIEDLYLNKIIGRFNQGKLQWTMVNYEALEPLVQVLMYGAQKYDKDNWKKACPKRLDLLDSLERHYIKLVAGESIDPESGLPHIGHLMCNAMFYSYWEQKTNGEFENEDNNPLPI